MEIEDDDLNEMLSGMGASAPPPPKVVAAPVADDDGDSAEDFLAAGVVSAERTVPDITKAWMKHHEFVLVRSIQQLNEIVDAAIASGGCGLDLETEGLDNRIFYDDAGKPYTKHKIVGYCLSYDGHTGYYAPIRHNPEDGGTNLNLPIAEADAAIRRLCEASQPTGVAASVEKDPLSFRDWSAGPRVVLYFWNAKFDQEFLYPVTGIDWWHPDSFEDGNLLYFTYYSGDHQLSLKDKSLHELVDIEGNPYEMIKLKELFVQGRRDIHFALLAPDEPGCVKYAGSDAICTFLLCTDPRKHEKRKPIMKLVKAKYNFTYRLEKQTSQAVRWMERPRVRVNKGKCEVLRVQNLEKRDALGLKIRALAEAKGFMDFEPSSSKQLSAFLFTDKGLNISLPINSQDWPNGKPPINEKSGQFKTDADTLEGMLAEHPSPPEVLQWVVDWRGFEKMNGTYLDNLVNNLDERSELRFQFKQTGAATGRFSAPAGDPSQGHSGIAIHGIPGTSAIREAFEARDGFTMVKADFAGEELRIAANVSGEMVWIKEFLEGDGDLHSITARAFFGKQNVSKDERKMGKCVHPDTLVYVDNRLTTLRSALTFPTESDTFRETAGTIHDGASWKKLSATFNGGTKPLVHVVVSGGVLTCTENHRFEMRDGSFVRAGDLQPGALLRQVSIPTVSDHTYPMLCVNLEGVPSAQYKLTHDFAYFAGLFVGDGTGNASSAALSHGAAGVIDDYGHDYEDWIQSLERSTQACGFTTSRKDKAQLYLGSRAVVRFLQALGIQGKAQKSLRVPAWVLEAGRDSILHYLGGLFDTDGTVGVKSPNLDWTTKSFVLAGQVATAMRACGLDFNTELTFNKTYKRYYTRLRLTVESSWILRSYMKHQGKLARLRLRAPLYEGRKKDRFEVLRVLPSEESFCVDVSVGESHRYLANGFVTHNTANFALIYGGGPAAIMRATGCDKLEASRRKQAFDKAVPAFAQWIKGQHAKVKKDKGVWTPLNRWIAIPDIDVPDPKVIAACERKSTNFPIQGGGADVMKFCLVLLCREFYKRKWIKQAGNDWIRMLLTVHDEIVFEIKHSLVQEALALICHVMASPAAIPKNPAWRVPLVVEPLIGLNWGAQYDYGMLMHGKPLTPDYKPYGGKNPKYKNLKFNWMGTSWSHLTGCPGAEGGACDCGAAKDIEIVVGDRVYHKVPPWLEGLFIPPYLQKMTPVTEHVPSNSGVVASPEVQTPPVGQVAAVSVQETPKPSLVQLAPAKPVERARDVAVEVFCVKLNILSYHTVRQVRTCIAEAMDPDAGKVLCLVDGPSGRELIEPTRGIKVIPEVFVKSMKERNLSNGEIFSYKAPSTASS